MDLAVITEWIYGLYKDAQSIGRDIEEISADYTTTKNWLISSHFFLAVNEQFVAPLINSSHI